MGLVYVNIKKKKSTCIKFFFFILYCYKDQGGGLDVEYWSDVRDIWLAMELNKGCVMKGDDECGRYCVRRLRRGIRPYKNIEERER